MKYVLAASVAAMLLTVGVSFSSAEEAKVEAKCPVSGKAIDKSHSVAHNGGDVYFCCPNCPKAFKANTEKFAPKANHQLVVTGQAKQTACPFAGRPANDSKSVSVGGVNVAFCCGNCLAKAKKSEGNELVALIFADAPFKKGFEVKED